MTATKRITQFLDAADVRYQIDHHDACFSAQTLAAEEETSGYWVAKTVVCFADGRPVILVLPAPYHVDLGVVGIELGAEVVRLADPEEMARLFPEAEDGVAPPPLPLWDAVLIHADCSMLKGEDVIFAAGTANDAICMSREDWNLVARPSFGQFAVEVDGERDLPMAAFGISP